jgi:hypothetical protein
MAEQTGPTRLHALFESALQAYQKTTGITLAEHPLAMQLQSCNSLGSITTVLQDQAQAFSNFRESDRIMKSIKTIVSILTSLSAAVAFADTLDMVRQRAPLACFTSLTGFFYSHSHLPRQYMLGLLSSLVYVPIFRSDVGKFVTSM